MARFPREWKGTSATQAAKNGVEASRASRKDRTKPHGVDPATGDIEYTDDELEFMFAMHGYRRVNHRPFPTWSEALRVLIALGYRKVAPSEVAPDLAPVVVAPVVPVRRDPNRPKSGGRAKYA